VHPNDRRRVVRALELTEVGSSLAPAVDRLWTEETRLPTTIVALVPTAEELDARIRARTAQMLARGAVAEARAAWAGPLSATARKVLGLEEFATLPPDEAFEEVVAATRRLARYQRKWLRRMPGVASLAGDRDAEEIADDIVALAGAGEHLPRR
jgi:tRNA dimethylallyltransferase